MQWGVLQNMCKTCKVSAKHKHIKGISKGCAKYSQGTRVSTWDAHRTRVTYARHAQSARRVKGTCKTCAMCNACVRHAHGMFKGMFLYVQAMRKG